MPDKPSDTFQKGVEAGLEGKSSSDNPHERGVLDSVFNAVVSIPATGGTVDLNADQDRAASEWEAGRQEGGRLSNEKK